MELLRSAEELIRTLVGSRGAENGEPWLGILLVATTGNNGCDTGTGVDAGSPGGATGNDGWSPGDTIDGIGGLKFCTGNKGCWTNPKGPGGGTDTAGCWVNHGWGRGGTGQPAGGNGTAGL